MSNDSVVMSEPAKILVVDDDEANLIALAKLLEQIPQVSCHRASSGPEALKLCALHRYAVVLLDVCMPGMSGFETAVELRRSENNSSTPIIFVTAIYTNEKNVFEGYGQGAVDYLFKPVDQRILLPKVQQFVAMESAAQSVQIELATEQVRSSDISSLLTAARAVLELEEFPKSARKVFDAAKEATGATAGYVALLSPDGAENEVLFLDAGRRPCTVDPELPMPIRGLRAEAYKRKRAVYDNDFMHGKWMEFMPKAHVPLENVLFAPLIVDGSVRGVMGLANKPGGFTTSDAEQASAFGDFAAIALRNAHNMDRLNDSLGSLLRAQTQAGMGSFIKDMDSGEVVWSAGMYVLFGIDPAQPNEGDPFLMAPEAVRKAVASLFNKVVQEKKSAEDRLVLTSPGALEGHFHFHAEAELDVKGRVRRLLGTCLDYSEQHRMARKLLATQRLEAVGQLAGGVAHEINTPIQYVMTNIEYVEQTLHAFRDLCSEMDHLASGNEPLARELRETIDRSGVKKQLGETMTALADSREGLDRVAAIVTAMRQLAPAAAEGREPLDINHMVQDLVTVTRREWEDAALVSVDLATDLPRVAVSRGEMSQAILNVLMNAFQAVAGNGASGSTSKGRIGIRTGLDAGQVVVTIEDDGPGIAEEHQDRIFDPFFTTKEVGAATGQGLALSHFIVQGHGGSIDFTSGPGEGTTFFIRLPIHEDT